MWNQKSVTTLKLSRKQYNFEDCICRLQLPVNFNFLIFNFFILFFCYKRPLWIWPVWKPSLSLATTVTSLGRGNRGKQQSSWKGVTLLANPFCLIDRLDWSIPMDWRDTFRFFQMKTLPLEYQNAHGNICKWRLWPSVKYPCTDLHNAFHLNNLFWLWNTHMHVLDINLKLNIYSEPIPSIFIPELILKLHNYNTFIIV